MTTVTLEQAQAELPKLIEQLQPGEDIVITRDDRAVARLIAEVPPQPRPRKLGTMQGTVLYMAPDFDTPLDCFKDYMK